MAVVMVAAATLTMDLITVMVLQALMVVELADIVMDKVVEVVLELLHRD
jgi:hypothetical protein